MITIEQIRAGRGLLNWTQKQLAKNAGISLRSLNSIEKGDVVPRLDTLIQLRLAMESNHVIFTDDNGVKLKGERLDIEKYEGETCQEILLNDIVAQLRQTGGSSYSIGVNEEKYNDLNEKLTDKFLADCWKYKINNFVAVEKGFTNFLAHPSYYKWVQKDMLGKLAYSIYGDTIAFIIWEPSERIVIIRNKTMADHFLNHFMSLWKQAETPPFNRYLEKEEDLNIPWSATRSKEIRERIKKMGY